MPRVYEKDRALFASDDDVYDAPSTVADGRPIIASIAAGKKYARHAP